jgi:two-component system LytT family sensor kinase
VISCTGDLPWIGRAPRSARRILGRVLGPGVRFWLVVLAIWSLLAVLSVGQTALYLAHLGGPIRWRTIIVGRLANWYTCAPFLPLLFWLARRFPIERRNWGRTVPLTLVVSLACAVAKCAVYLPIDRFLSDRSATLASLLAADTMSELTIFWAVLGIIHAVEFYRRYQTRQADAVRLEGELAGARLEALASQLRPHFLFNTLGAIGELTHQDPDSADRMLKQLADLLRETLRRPSDADIPLFDEIALLDRYVGIMRVRYGSRLTVAMDLTDQAGEALVPAFLLQPLVENAFEHGIARRPGPGRVHIAASTGTSLRGDAELWLVVEDDGVGLAEACEENGIGLATTRQRLVRRYGDRHRFLLQVTPGGGTQAKIVIPFVPRSSVSPPVSMSSARVVGVPA